MKNIINKETLAAFENGVPAAETKLGKFAIKAFKETDTQDLSPHAIKKFANHQTTADVTRGCPTSSAYAIR